MKKGSKEFEELRKQFELSLSAMPVYIGAKPERENKECSAYYTNGIINSLFVAYMNGYQSAKCLARMGALPTEG